MKSGAIRPPAVAGTFYAGSAGGLRKQIEGCYLNDLGPGKLPELGQAPRHIKGLVSPHAGYMYSGHVAAYGFAAIAAEKKPHTVVILGPNHYGQGAPVSVSGADSWQTPLGAVPLDSDSIARLMALNPLLQKDDMAHSREHSLEVQVPFLQHLYGDNFKLIPIALLRMDVITCVALGQSLAAVLNPKDTLVIASSDFTHYEPARVAQTNDHMAIEPIERLDPEGLAETVTRLGVTMCGPGPIMAMMAASKAWGAKEGKLLCYATSGDVTGDRSQVVGYASLEVRG